MGRKILDINPSWVRKKFSLKNNLSLLPPLVINKDQLLMLANLP